MNAERPIGVSIATIWAGLFAGVFPLGLFLYFYFGPAKGSTMVGGLQLALSLALGLGVIFSAIGARNGSRSARNLLIVLIIVHYGLVAYQNYQLASAGVEIRGSSMIPVGRFVRSIVTPVLISGYLLLSRRAQEFYRQEQ